MENRVFCLLLKVNLCHEISNPRSVRSEYKMPVNRQVELVNRYNFRISKLWVENFHFFREKLELKICKIFVYRGLSNRWKEVERCDAKLKVISFQKIFVPFDFLEVNNSLCALTFSWLLGHSWEIPGKGQRFWGEVPTKSHSCSFFCHHIFQFLKQISCDKYFLNSLWFIWNLVDCYHNVCLVNTNAN